VTDHFDGELFYNAGEDPRHGKSPWAVLRWMNTRNPKPWPKWVEQPIGGAPPARVTDRIRVTFVNHATMLIQVGGLNILTDPVWSRRIGPPSWLGIAGAKRIKHAGLKFEELPPIDFVLISHNHNDHLDLPTLERLRATRPSTRIVAGLGTSAFLKLGGVGEGEDIDWWQEIRLNDQVTLTAVPAHHWSMRWLGDRNHSLWAGFVLKTPQGAIYFAGDTAMGSFVTEIQKRIGPIRLAFLPIGGYLPRWFYHEHHIDPPQAVEMHRLLGVKTSIPMHYGTFRHSDEDYGQPVLDLRAAQKKQDVPESEFAVLKEGESWESTAP